MNTPTMITLERHQFGKHPVNSTLYYGWDVLESLKAVEDKSVHCIVTSPPYWNLRSYLTEDSPLKVQELGTEQSPGKYVENLVRVFQEVKRVLRDDGTLWLVMGDKYGPGSEESCPNLLGIPWRIAFALQSNGWALRAEIVWEKPNAMPESVHNRPTRSHEQIFILTLGGSYFYDSGAVKEPTRSEASGNTVRLLADGEGRGRLDTHLGSGIPWKNDGMGRNRRSVWSICTRPYQGAHFAVFPPELVEPCIKAGTSEKGCCPKCGAPWVREIGHREDVQALDVSTGGYPERNDGGTRERAASGSGGGTQLATRKVSLDTWKQGCSCPDHEPVPCTVLDPFSGSATTGYVANNLGRDFIGLDINPDYIDLAKARILDAKPPTDKEESFVSVLTLLGE